MLPRLQGKWGSKKQKEIQRKDPISNPKNKNHVEKHMEKEAIDHHIF